MIPGRPITILIAALGGEGGASIARWITAAAESEGHLVQSTSIPGVAQRTGATTYYLEIIAGGRAGPEHVMALAPTPGAVDLVLASELVEAGRALQNGYVSPDRTTLVASSHRIFAVAEKGAMSDGRYDTSRIERAARSLAKRLILFDMSALVREHEVPITVALLGAAAASLPIGREALETALRSSKSGPASLRAFAAGWDSAAGSLSIMPRDAAATIDKDAPSTLLRAFPAVAQPILERGMRRCVDYQDDAYGKLYLTRLMPIAELDRRGGGQADAFRLTVETARHAALWMTYEDVIRVADLKTRRDRFDQVRREAGAQPDQPLRVIEFLKPGLDEVCAMLPRWLAIPMRRFAERHGYIDRLNVGVRITSNGLTGFLVLRALASMRPLRRLTSRWHDEQDRIETWLSAIRSAAASDVNLAREIAECATLIKGYGDTHRRGARNFDLILSFADQAATAGDDLPQLAEFVRKARAAALADPDGMVLSRMLDTRSGDGREPMSAMPHPGVSP